MKAIGPKRGLVTASLIASLGSVFMVVGPLALTPILESAGAAQVAWEWVFGGSLAGAWLADLGASLPLTIKSESTLARLRRLTSRSVSRSKVNSSLAKDVVTTAEPAVRFGLVNTLRHGIASVVQFATGLALSPLLLAQVTTVGLGELSLLAASMIVPTIASVAIGIRNATSKKIAERVGVENNLRERHLELIEARLDTTTRETLELAGELRMLEQQDEQVIEETKTAALKRTVPSFWNSMLTHGGWLAGVAAPWILSLSGAVPVPTSVLVSLAGVGLLQFSPVSRLPAAAVQLSEQLVAAERWSELNADDTEPGAQIERPFEADGKPMLLRFHEAGMAYPDGTSLMFTGGGEEDLTLFNLTSPGLTLHIGPNGSGKSTLLKILVGLEEPTLGSVAAHLGLGFKPSSDSRVAIGGKSTDDVDIREIDRDSRLGMWSWAPQTPKYPSWFTVADAFALGNRQIDRTQIVSMLTELGMDDPSEQLDRRVASLSGGQQQLVSVGATIARDRPGTVFDEPTNHLDADVKGNVLAQIMKLAETRSVHLITHDMDVVDRLLLPHAEVRKINLYVPQVSRKLSSGEKVTNILSYDTSGLDLLRSHPTYRHLVVSDQIIQTVHHGDATAEIMRIRDRDIETAGGHVFKVLTGTELPPNYLTLDEALARLRFIANTRHLEGNGVHRPDPYQTTQSASAAWIDDRASKALASLYRLRAQDRDATYFVEGFGERTPTPPTRPQPGGPETLQHLGP